MFYPYSTKNCDKACAKKRYTISIFLVYSSFSVGCNVWDGKLLDALHAGAFIPDLLALPFDLSPYHDSF